MNALAALKAEMVAGVADVLAGKSPKFEAHNITPVMIAEHLEMELGGWEKGDLETNGWQYDWWITFTKGDKSFTASGGGYYGNFRFANSES